MMLDDGFVPHQCFAKARLFLIDFPADMFCFRLAAPELFLVLPLCGGEEVFQDAPQVLKCGPVLRLFPPAQQHDVVEPV